MSTIDWLNTSTWGQRDTCVHISDNGSDVGDRHDLTSGGEH